MIRDPSDGTVREAPNANLQGKLAGSKASPEIAHNSHNSHNSGLRQPTKTDAMQRIEFSREWLKNYHAKRGIEHADGGSNGTEHSTDGRTGNDQGEGQP